MLVSRFLMKVILVSVILFSEPIILEPYKESWLEQCMMDAIRSAKFSLWSRKQNTGEDPNDRPSLQFMSILEKYLDKSHVNAVRFLVARAVKGVNSRMFQFWIIKETCFLKRASWWNCQVAGQMMKLIWPKSDWRRRSKPCLLALSKECGRKGFS